MQRLITRCVEIFGSDLFYDKRLADLALEPGASFGLWVSSEDDLIGFRELRQLEPTRESESTAAETRREQRHMDVTPSTRSTWSVFLFPRMKRVPSEDNLPDPRLQAVSHIIKGSLDHSGGKDECYEYVEKEQGFACIEAYEQGSGTRIDFLDACDPIGAMDWNLPLPEIPIGSAFDEFCDWVIYEIWDAVDADLIQARLHIEDIDSFIRVKGVRPEEVNDVVSEGWLDIEEDRVQTGIEEILQVAFHKKDWGGEENDLYTANVILEGKRIPTAFVLKGRGTKRTTLRISDCGKNGDQLVRLFQSPAELFVVQFVGEISENVIKDVESKVRLLRSQGGRAWYCIIDGQDTARLLRAYGKL
jgi:hypothetical protein